MLNCVCFLIGNGPARLGVVGRVITLLLGVLLVVAGSSPDTRLRGAFMHGKGPSVPIGSAGRVITLLLAFVMFYGTARLVRYAACTSTKLFQNN